MVCTHCNDTGSLRGDGYLDCFYCDAPEILSKAEKARRHGLSRTAEERLLEEAAVMRVLLAEYIEPVLPAPFKSHAEWKTDFDCRVRCTLLRIRGV